MFETELKFQVPAGVAALRKAVATSTAVQTRLQALYVETPGHDLAAAGLALRLRKEGRVWVQTLKGRGDGLMQRLEHEVRLPQQAGPPALDPARHDDSPAGALLRAALARAREAGRSDELRVLYRTDIRRTLRRLRHAGALVELALDEGWIMAEGVPAAPGESVPQYKLPVCELELELISGPAPALAELAARWVARHGLWWDVRTKSERGFRLALQRHRVPAVRAGKRQLPAGQALAPALAAMLQASLAHALPNMAELAGAPPATPAAPEHLHQLRVAMRRLRSALQQFSGWAPDEAAALALEARWQQVFAALGAARDADVLATTWQPRLAAAGAPDLPGLAAAVPAGASPQQQVQAPAFSVLLLDTLAFSLRLAAVAEAGEPADALPQGPAEESGRGRAARAVLRKAWKRAWQDCEGFASASVAQQHRARKRLKRLRYALEFVAPLLPPKPLKRWLALLAPALEALGEVNDLETARAHYSALAQQQPQAFWAAGWLAAQQPAAAALATARLAALESAPRPWKTRASRAEPRAESKAAPKAKTRSGKAGKAARKAR